MPVPYSVRSHAGLSVLCSVCTHYYVLYRALFEATLVVATVSEDTEHVVPACVFAWLATGVADRLYRAGVVFFAHPDDSIEHQQVAVPLNVEMVMSRVGEFVMLCLGEGVLNITISTLEFSFVFYAYVMSGLSLLIMLQVFSEYMCGTFIIRIISCPVSLLIMLQFLFYSSQPPNAGAHALNRSKDAGAMWSLMAEGTAMSYIMVGAGLKMALEATATDGEEVVAGTGIDALQANSSVVSGGGSYDSSAQSMTKVLR
jgi:hypothetical protein